MDKIHRTRLDKVAKLTFYNVAGVILPFVLSAIGIIYFMHYGAFLEYLDQGQFLLFGAGLFTSSILGFQDNQRSMTSYTDKILSSSSIWLLIICSAFYAIVYCSNLLAIQSQSVNTAFIRWSSILLFAVSILSVYRSITLDIPNWNPPVDVEMEGKRGVENILNQL